MALLQISEPGQSPDPHRRRHSVGIDLGTTHSLVAAVRHGVAECLPDAEGRVLLPSVVRYLDGGRRAVGHDARAAAATDPADTLSSTKRWMGRTLADIGEANALPYRFVDRPGMVGIATRDGVRTPVEVAAEILATLRQRAEDTLDASLDGAVITVPAYFDDAQRQATKDAAALAGLTVLRLVNEPTAAALAYGLDRGAEGLYAVYDLGGGTFDVSLLKLTRGVFEVVAKGGDVALGGDDIDATLADHWVAGGAAGGGVAAADRRALLDAARSAKEATSATVDPDERVRVEARVGGAARTFEITRRALDVLARPLVDRTITILRSVLRDGGATPATLAGVVMVGGATRMPAVRSAVEAVIGRPPLVDVNPDEVVAIGAALQAHALVAGDAAGGTLLLDVTPLSLGLETMGGLVERIVERNTPIPTAQAQEFTTYQDGQTALAVHVVQGERDLADECRSLARFTLRGIPPMTAGAARIRVTFAIDADGLLQVTAREQVSGVQAQVDVKPSYGLADDEIASMLRAGAAHADLDMQQRLWREAEVDARRIVQATGTALAADADLLDATDRAAIDASRAALQQRLDDGPGPDATASAHALQDATEALAKATEGFAAARMNRSIRDALRGRTVDQL